MDIQSLVSDSLETNKAIMRRVYDEMNRGNVAAAAELISPRFVDHASPLGAPPGLEGTKEFLLLKRKAFPDLHIEVEDVVAENDIVAARFVCTGHQDGEFMCASPLSGDFQCIPSTGKLVTFRGIDIVRIAEGKLVEHWDDIDAVGLMEQLGLRP